MTADATMQDATAAAETMMTTGKRAVDQMVETTTTSYEKVMQLGKERLDQVNASMEDLKSFSEGNLDAIVATGNATVKAFETLSSELAAFGKQTWEDQVAAIKATVGAKSVQEAFELQRDFAKTSYDALIAESNKLSEMVPQLAKDTVEPLNERAKIAYEKFVTAAA